MTINTTIRPQLCDSRKIASGRLRLIREPSGHYVIDRIDATGQSIVGESDTFVLARQLYRRIYNANHPGKPMRGAAVFSSARISGHV